MMKKEPCVGYQLKCRHAFCHECIDGTLKPLKSGEDDLVNFFDDVSEENLNTSMSTRFSQSSKTISKNEPFSFSMAIKPGTYGRVHCIMCNRNIEVYMKHYALARDSIGA